MADHAITTQYWNSSNGTVATCTCGWIDRWEGSDGSAEQSGAAHVARMERKDAR